MDQYTGLTTSTIAKQSQNKRGTFPRLFHARRDSASKPAAFPSGIILLAFRHGKCNRLWWLFSNDIENQSFASFAQAVRRPCTQQKLGGSTVLPVIHYRSMRREITIIAFLSVFVLVNFVSVKDFLSQEYFNFNGITTNTGRFQALPPVHVNSSWIGNQWIPPRGYHTFSPVDFLDYFASSRTTKTTTAKKPLSVLILGDSTGRRTYATLFALLEAAAAAASSPATSSHNIRVQALDARHVIDFGKNGAPNERCLPKSADDEKYPGLACVRHIPSTMGESHIHGNSTQQSTSNNKTHHDDDDDDAANRFDLFGLNCLSTFASLVQDPNSILWRRRSPSRSTTAGDKNSSAGDEPFYSLVIFAFGPWEYMNRIECGVHDGRLNSTLDAFGHFVSSRKTNTKQQPQQRFVWRTWGTFGTSRNSPAAARAGWQKSRAHNGLVKKLISEHNVQHYDAHRTTIGNLLRGLGTGHASSSPSTRGTHHWRYRPALRS